MNQLKVKEQETIVSLHARGWSKRKLARELGLDRETVRRYIALAAAKPPTVQTGSDDVADPKPPGVQTGSQASLCAPWQKEIEEGLKAGLSVKRIHQDLVCEHRFGGSYYSLWRFVLRLRPEGVELPFRRMECAPGEELQIDFGQGAWVVEDGKRRRPHLFRCVLSYSRKAYSEVVWQQTTESFIRCVENAFRYFGGVTATLVIDNLKAGVIRPDWYDPELNPKLAEFARHYGTVVLPCKPRMARHKGKVEAGVKYSQNNALKGRIFKSLAEQNLFHAQWEKNTADKRIHGTTRKQVGTFFEEVEKPALQPLPSSIFPVFVEAPRMVHRDGYVEFQRAYYSAPPEYVGRKVWVRQELRVLRIYSERREQIAVHALAEPGKFTTDAAHVHSRKRHIIERGAAHLLDQCRRIGVFTGTWAQAMHQVRGPQGMRVMQGLLRLAEKHPVSALEKAAQTATEHGAWRLRDLKQLMELPANVVQLTFLETHPLIRSLKEYQILVEEDPPSACADDIQRASQP